LDLNIAELRFLVVEDQGFQLWVVRNLLEGLGAKYVFAAADGRPPSTSSPAASRRWTSS
jgi:hypothetical protein